MSRNILPIFLIFVFSSAAWVILGSSIMVRTQSTDSDLSSRVATTWGAPQQQTPPAAFTSRTVQKQIRETHDNGVVTKTVEETITTILPIEQSRINVMLNLEQRQKGLLWFPTYRVDYRGSYVPRTTTAIDAIPPTLTLPLPPPTYDHPPTPPPP